MPRGRDSLAPVVRTFPPIAMCYSDLITLFFHSKTSILVLQLTVIFGRALDYILSYIVTLSAYPFALLVQSTRIPPLRFALEISF